MGAAEHDVAFSGAAVAVGTGIARADDQIVDAVAVDVAGCTDGSASEVERVDAVDDEAIRAGERRQFELAAGAEARGAEHDVSGAGFQVSVG